MKPLSFKRKLTSSVYVIISGIGAYGVLAYMKQDEYFYKNAIIPLVHQLEPETAHNFGVFMHKYRLIPKTKYQDPEALKVKVFGKEFPNPIGIAAGFDKNGEAVLGLKDIGFGFIEIGSVTPRPQLGNKKPRVFRLEKDKAVINRYGFNNDGHAAVLERLSIAKKSLNNNNGIVGVNLGKNRTSTDPIHDYVLGVERFAPVADYLVINVSSPNTPGLRTMQHKAVLKELLEAVLVARNNLATSESRPILLKLAPDLDSDERKDIADVIALPQCRVDGLIVCNTTVDRPQYLNDKDKSSESGGLSGKPLKSASTQMIGEMYKLTQGKVPIIGVGGIFNGKDAYEKIKAGASVLQIYTSYVYKGPPVVKKIKKELHQLLVLDGYENIAEAVGKDVKKC